MFAHRHRLSHFASVCVSVCVALAVTSLSGAGCDATIGPPSAIVDAPTGAIDAPAEPADAPTGAIDASTQPPIDAAVTVDGAPLIDAPPVLQSCDDIYGQAPAYELCQELEDLCLFNAATNGGNCNDICSQLGGECIEAYDNDPGAPCVFNQLETCADNRDDEICVCTRL